MKTRLLTTALICVLTNASGLFQTAVWAAPVGTAFSYLGHLNDGSTPANGFYLFNFALYDAETGPGLAPGTAPIGIPSVPVSNGLFRVTLDFGPDAFYGEARWLEVKVRSATSAIFETLHPRQPVTLSPYAIYATTAANLTPLLRGPRFDFRVNDIGGLRLEPASDGSHVNVIGGGLANQVDANVRGATIAGGGGRLLQGNRISSDLGVIGGGEGNSIFQRSTNSTIAGGSANTIGEQAKGSVIAGGEGNLVAVGPQSEADTKIVPRGVEPLVAGIATKRHNGALL